MTKDELIGVFQLTGEVLQRPEPDPTVIELCNVAGRMAFELLWVSEAPAIALNEPAAPLPREKGLSAADASSSTDQSIGASTDMSTIEMSTAVSTSRPKRKRNWAELKRRQRAKQRAARAAEPEARP
jgi:hypothetical protein